MTISKEQIEFVLKEARECLKYASYDKSFWKTVITVLKDRLEWMNPKNIITLPTAQPSEALEALERISQGIHDSWVSGKDWPETQDYQLVRAALQRNDVPKGFVLVPIEPTDEMCSAGVLHCGDGKYPDFVWEDMIAAAPKPTGE